MTRAPFESIQNLRISLSHLQSHPLSTSPHLERRPAGSASCPRDLKVWWCADISVASHKTPGIHRATLHYGRGARQWLIKFTGEQKEGTVQIRGNKWLISACFCYLSTSPQIPLATSICNYHCPDRHCNSPGELILARCSLGIFFCFIFPSNLLNSGLFSSLGKAEGV